MTRRTPEESHHHVGGTVKRDKLVTLEQARERYRREFEGVGETMKFRAWLRQWWPDFFTPDARLRRILGKNHPNVVLGDQRRAARRNET